ncbi:hypothetical protein N658DRAFT_433352 [Parathielavia hyrcaniae]|uniref:Mitochondrial chaperone BCS1 n=1 Tax=Parathielavia hyrcaniae TaxID=113614 RepID=A0AAN6PTQ0_9PEZI|nr:hypothetical protein N658DRAFT_433352 [Parathielavia hyrcaniae]
MDFNSLIQGALPTFVANASHGANTSAERGLSGLLDTLSPLLGFQLNPLMRVFMIVYNMVGSHLGIDPTYIITSIGFFWAVNKVGMQLSTTFDLLARQYFMANIEVSNSDDIYSHVMKWLASLPRMVDSRSLTAETASKSAWDQEDESELMTARVSPDGHGIFLNFSNQEAEAAPRFTPAMGVHSFWFRGRYFKLQRRQESLFDPSAGANGMPQYKDKETLVLSVFGRSPEPIKQLLQHAKEQYYQSHQAQTIVRRPAGPAMRRYGHRHSWQQVANRPVRPMKTVVLGDEQKIRILSDMNEYLHPATARWYANRGIPLRRGYLFHGPPGTGKTSLSFALAGVFGLDIYVISLLDPTLTEEDLLALFTSLPRRCVVLLEDIDTAGLRRNDDPESSSSSSSDDEKNSEEQEEADKDKKSPKKPRYKSKKDWKVSDLAREFKRHGNSDSTEKKSISLSGLLNAIDGVASHEGRVLIMTTNKPEALDEALTRPGRVDLQVVFTNATKEQARELFIRMYEPDRSRAVLPSPAPPLTPFSAASATPFSVSSEENGNLTDVSGATKIGHDDPSSPALPPTTDGGEKEMPEGKLHPTELSPTELSYIAEKFAEKIPPGQFSPAELQGFLLERKKTPQQALEEAEGWIEGMVALKASRTRVSAVQ